MRVVWLMKWDEIVICFKINTRMYTLWLGPTHHISSFYCYLEEAEVEVAKAGI